MGITLCSFKSYEILFTLVTTNQIKLFTYYNFKLKVVYTLRSKTNLFPDYHKDIRYQKEKNKISWERSCLLNTWDLPYRKIKRSQTGCLGLPESHPSWK